MGAIHSTASLVLRERLEDLSKAVAAISADSVSPHAAQVHLLFLAEALARSDVALFVSHLARVSAELVKRGEGPSRVRTDLGWLRETLEARLERDVRMAIGAYLDAAIEMYSESAAATESAMPSTDSMADEYLQLLLRGDRKAASDLILDAVARGLSVKKVYLEVFQPSLWEIGRLWETNKVSVAQEHFFTASTQLVMGQLYPRIFRTEKNGLILVATCVHGELHEIGVRMVADFFEMEGWDTYYLGANAPADSVVETIEQRRAHLLAASATLPSHVARVEEIVRAVREVYGPKQVRILVGGRAFADNPVLWRQIGADGHADNAQEGVKRGRALVLEGATDG